MNNALYYKNSLPDALHLPPSKPQHRYGRPSLVVLVLFQTEKNVNKRSIPPRKRKSNSAGRGSENGRAAGLRGPISTFARPARRPRRCRPYLSFQLQIIQNSSSRASIPLSNQKFARKRVPQPRGKIQHPKSPPPPLSTKKSFTYLTSMLTS